MGVDGAMTVLIKDVLFPTLMQTVELTPVLVHAGHFSRFATGNSSIVAEELSLKIVGQEVFL